MMYAHCVVAILALITIPLSFALVSVDAPLNAADCQPVSLTWEGGIEPWLLRILSASSPNPVISDLASSTGPQFTWIVDIEPGTSVILQVLDSTGDTGVSTPFTIQPGTSLNGHCPVGASSGGGGLGQGGGQVSSGGTLPSGTNSSSGGESGGTSAGGGGTSDSSGSSTGTDTGGADGTTSSSAGGSDTSNDTPTVSQHPGDSLADASSVAAKPVSPSDHSLPNGNSASSDPSVSTSTTSSVTSTPSIETQVSKSVSASNSASGFSTFDSTSGSPTSSPSGPPGPLGGGAGQGLPATTAISSDGSSMGTGESNVGSSSFSKKNVMTGSIIGGIIAGVLCALLAAFCVIRRCRRRRLDEPDSLVYPFNAASGSEAAVPREMVGRSGYPASTFSSWGNHGDLADERALSPISPVASTEGPPWETGQGTIESRYAAAFTPGHTASSSSIDRNDPTTQRRFRGPIPKNMIDALHAGPADAPFSAILGEQSNGGHATDGSSAHVFDEIQPQEVTSWGRVHDMMDGRHPVVVGYPPPYTSR